MDRCRDCRFAYSLPAANWTLVLRVTGEGGVKAHGKRLLGRKMSLAFDAHIDPKIGDKLAELVTRGLERST